MLMILIALSASAYDPETSDVVEPEAFAQMEQKIDDATAQLEELAARLEAAAEEAKIDDGAGDGAADGEAGDTQEPAEDADEAAVPEEDED